MNNEMELKIRDFILKFLNQHWGMEADFKSLRKVYRRSSFINEIKTFLLGVFLALGEDEKAIEIEVQDDKQILHFYLTITIIGIGAFIYSRNTMADWKITGVIINKEKETHDRANNYPKLPIPQE